MIPTEILLVSIVGYFLGSIPFALLIAKAHGVNILEAGSGNPGATNVKRVIGKRAGNLCFFLDFTKGALAALWPSIAVIGLSHPDRLALVGMTAAIVGHSFSLFMRFKGGKGVAVSMGGLLAAMPWVFGAGIAAWLITFYSSRYVSLASIVFGCSLPLGAWLFDYPRSHIIFTLLLSVIIVIRHRSNIQRLIAGTESRFTKNKN